MARVPKQNDSVVRKAPLKRGTAGANYSRKETSFIIDTLLSFVARDLQGVVFLHDASGRLRACSPGVARLTGYGVSFFRTGEFLDTVHPLDRPLVARAWKALLRGVSFEGRFRYRGRTGRIRWCDARWRPLHDHAGALHGVLRTERDCTELVALERERESHRSMTERITDILGNGSRRLKRRRAAPAGSEGHYQQLLDSLPSALAHPDCVGVSLRIGTGHYHAGLRSRSKKMISHPITVNDGIIGELIVWQATHGSTGPVDFTPSDRSFILRLARTLSLMAAIHYAGDTMLIEKSRAQRGFKTSLIEQTSELYRAYRELSASERRFRAIFDCAYQFVGMLDTAGRLLEVNQTALDFGGIAADAVIGSAFWDCPWWSHDASVQQELRQAVDRAARGEFVRYRTRVRSASGEIVPIDFSIKPVFDDDGRVSMLIPEGRVIAEQVKAEEALKASEELFNTAFQLNPLPMSINAHDMSFIAVNQAFQRETGYAEQEVVGKRGVDLGIFVYSADRLHIQEILDRDGGLRDYPAQIRTRDGSILDVLFSYRAVRIGGRSCYLSVGYNVTRQVRTEEALRASEELFNTAFQLNPMPMTINAQDTSLIAVNKAFQEKTGYAEHEVIGKRILDLELLVEPNESAHIQELMARDGTLRNYPVRVRSRDGGLDDVLLSHELVTIQGRTCYLTVAQYVTESFRAEEALRASEERFSKAFELTPMPMAITTLDRHFVAVNQAFEQLTGMAIEDVLGHRAQELGLWEDEQERDSIDTELIINGSVRDKPMKIRSRSGRVHDMLFSYDRVTINGEPCFLSVAHDVTELRRTEKLLRDSEELFSSIFQLSPLPIVLLTMDGIVVKANQAFAQMAGATVGELVGRSTADMKIWDDEADRERFRDIIARDGCVHNFITSLCSIDGVRRTVMISAELLVVNDKEFIQGIATDMTEQLRAEVEIKRLSRELLQAQERERQCLAADLHDGVGQTIMAAMLNLKSALDGPPGEIERFHLVSRCLEEADRELREIAAGLFPAMLHDLGLAAVVRWHVANHIDGTRFDVRLAIDVEGRFDPLVEVNLYRLYQESVANAVRHAAATRIDIALTLRAHGLVLAVRDNGRGFDPQARNDRKGMGLVTMKQRIETIRGTLCIESSPGRGTLVEITVPLEKNHG